MAKILNPKPFVLEIEDLDGVMMTLTSTTVTKELANKMRLKAISDEAREKPIDAVIEQLCMAFDKKPEAFDNFSALVLVSTLAAFNEYTNTPIKTQN